MQDTQPEKFTQTLHSGHVVTFLNQQYVFCIYPKNVTPQSSNVGHFCLSEMPHVGCYFCYSTSCFSLEKAKCRSFVQKHEMGSSDICCISLTQTHLPPAFCYRTGADKTS